jgi:catechol 2,3-dioxygenase-like lactoylglutathione lyase family enzyme
LRDRRIFWDWLLQLLGYQPFQSWAEGRSWRVNGFYLVLIQTPDAHVGAGYHRRRIGLNHLAFTADDGSQVDQVHPVHPRGGDATEALRDRGGSILYEDRHPHAGGPDSYAVFFEDPDRIKVELVAP